jgi:hypothetical protein
MSEGRYNRCIEWRAFSFLVEQHIINYTIHQYGDGPNDQVAEWTPEQCKDSMQRYLNRFGKGARGNKESLRDMMKMAHFACLAYNKMKERMENDTNSI